MIMQKLTYYLFKAFSALFSIMPFGLAYVIADFLYFIIYRVVGYRKKVVMGNLRNSFPEKTEKELVKIAKGFYHHLTDLLVESMKSASMTNKEIVQRFGMKRSEILEEFYRQGRSVIVVAGHFNNWEWPGIAADGQMVHKPVGFYKPMSNPYMDALIKKNRVRGRSILASINDTVATFKTDFKEPAGFYMIADQSPSNVRLAFWVKFLNQDTAVLHGPEKYARIYNMPVVYVDIQKVKRGHYQAQFILLSEDSSKTKTGEITDKFMKTLEEKIRKNPQYYLWSHRRWKHKRPTP
jgi:KDO2-lipid IV(A) lauroyltransferase